MCDLSSYQNGETTLVSMIGQTKYQSETTNQSIGSHWLYKKNLVSSPPKNGWIMFEKFWKEKRRTIIEKEDYNCQGNWMVTSNQSSSQNIIQGWDKVNKQISLKPYSTSGFTGNSFNLFNWYGISCIFLQISKGRVISNYIHIKFGRKK